MIIKIRLLKYLKKYLAQQAFLTFLKSIINLALRLLFSFVSRKTTENQINIERRFLGRRRFEDGFILYTFGKICTKYHIDMSDIGITDRNLLLEQIYEKFYVKFVQHLGCKYNTIKIFQ